MTLKASNGMRLFEDSVFFFGEHSITGSRLLEQEVFSRPREIHVAGCGARLCVSFCSRAHLN